MSQISKIKQSHTSIIISLLCYPYLHGKLICRTKMCSEIQKGIQYSFLAHFSTESQNSKTRKTIGHMTGRHE